MSTFRSNLEIPNPDLDSSEFSLRWQLLMAGTVRQPGESLADAAARVGRDQVALQGRPTAAEKGSLGPQGSERPNSQSNRAINTRFAILKTKPDDRIA